VITKPKKFDRNLIVIGAGSAGLVSAYIASAVKASVSLIEKNKMGGDCLNTGCIPSKALIRSAGILAQAKRAKDYGFRSIEIKFNFAELMERVQRVINTVAPHDSIERYAALGVDCIQGDGRLTSPWSVEVNDKNLTARNIIIAAGASPFIPPVPGIEDVGYYTSDTIWDIRKLPNRLIVLGGGPIGSELTQCFARLGSQVTLIEMLPRILFREDPEISQLVKSKFEKERINVLTGHKAKNFRREGERKFLVCETQDQTVEFEFDELLVAVGRKANIKNYGLNEIGVKLTKSGNIEVNDYLQSSVPSIFACGDIAGPYQFTHTAAHQAWYASVNALFGPYKKFKVDYSVIPWATFTEPEIARVGLNETDAKAANVEYEISTFDISELDRAIADEEAHGLIKVLTVPGKDQILGVTIAGNHAGDLITEYISAMKYGIGLNKILGTIHIYPTMAEANKYVAGVWKKAHAPKLVLNLAKKFHIWRRG